MTVTLFGTQNNHEATSDFKSLRRRRRVSHLMTRDVLCLRYSDHLNLLDTSPDWRKFRHLPVIDDEGHLKGMVCHRDLMNDLASSLALPEDQRRFTDAKNIPVREAMIWNVLTANESDSLEDAAKKMFENRCGALPVVDWENHLIGLLTEADFAKVFYLGEDCLTQPWHTHSVSQAV